MGKLAGDTPDWVITFCISFSITAFLDALANVVLRSQLFQTDLLLPFGVSVGVTIGQAIRNRIERKKMREVYGDDWDEGIIDEEGYYR